MHCKGKLKLRSHNTSYCLIEVVTKAGLIVYSTNIISCKYWSNIYKNFNNRAKKTKNAKFCDISSKQFSIQVISCVYNSA